jgi:hypothetical protein
MVQMERDPLANVETENLFPEVLVTRKEKYNVLLCIVSIDKGQI